MLDYIMTVFRASTLVDAKSCKMQKTLHFTHFNQKNTHISGCKIVHKCIIATVTAHICMVTVAFAFNILVIFSLSLSLVALTLTSLSLFLIWSNHQTIWSLIDQSVDLTTTTDRLIKSSDHSLLLFDQITVGSHCLWISRCCSPITTSILFLCLMVLIRWVWWFWSVGFDEWVLIGLMVAGFRMFYWINV